MGHQELTGSRVERLHYFARSRGAIVFRNTHFDTDVMNWVNDGPADAAVATTADFQITLREDRATVEMLADCSTVDEARSIVEPFLRAWEIQAFLRHAARYGDFQQPLVFELDRADVVNPVRRPDVLIQVPAAAGFFYRAYPSPPDRFVASLDLQAMWLRWQEYQAGRESLPSMAYFCLTAVEASLGGARSGQRERAADRYAIDIAVLKTLGDLVSEVGEDRELRKAHAKAKRPYLPAERKWIELVILALMRRVGEVAYLGTTRTHAGEQFPQITLADFLTLA